MKDYLTKFIFNEDTYEDRLRIAYEELTTHGYSQGYAVLEAEFQRSMNNQKSNWESEYPEIKFTLDQDKRLVIKWEFTEN